MGRQGDGGAGEHGQRDSDHERGLAHVPDGCVHDGLVIVRQGEHGDRDESQSSEQVRDQGHRPQPDDLEESSLAGDHRVERQQELFREELGVGEFEREKTDAERHTGEDV